MPMVVEPQSLDSLSPEQLRSALLSMLQAAAAKDQELAFKQTLIDKLTHENALLKRMKFAAQSERFSPEQKSLLDDEIEADRPPPRRDRPSGCPCRRTCHAARSATNPRPPRARVAAR
jgi:hypothetical protein